MARTGLVSTCFITVLHHGLGIFKEVMPQLVKYFILYLNFCLELMEILDMQIYNVI